VKGKKRRSNRELPKLSEVKSAQPFAKTTGAKGWASQERFQI